MKKFLEKRFKNRGAGFYLGFATSVLMLIFSIVYIAADSADRTFSVTVFVLVLLGALIGMAYALIDVKLLDFLPVVSCVFYGVAFGQHLFLGLETLSDVWNDVNFIGGSPALAITFIVLFAVGTVASLVAAFLKED